MARKHKVKEKEIAESPKAASPIKYIAFGIAALIVVFAIGQVIAAEFGGSRTTATSVNQPLGAGTVATVGNDGVQEVQVTMQGWQYQPNPIRLKVGVPARLVVDLKTVTGCMRTIQIPDLGVEKYVSEGDNVIAFTPQKAGTFRMHCAMNMGQGIVIVEDANGNAPAATENLAATAPTGGGCGMMRTGSGSGGCGCGRN